MTDSSRKSHNATSWAIAAFIAMLVAVLVYATLAWAGYCAGNCTGTAGVDSLYGGAADQNISGLGSGDELYGGAGQDNVSGDGGAVDYIDVESGNGENGRGGAGVTDIVKVWNDTGSDFATGGAELNDYCYVDVPPNGNDTWDHFACEQVKKR